MKRGKKTLYRVPIRKAKRSIIADLSKVDDKTLRLIMIAGRSSLKALDRWAKGQINREMKARERWDDRQITTALVMARIDYERKETESDRHQTKSTPPVRVLRKPG